MELCDTRPSREVHKILTLLYLYYDMVESKTLSSVFGFGTPVYRAKETRKEQTKLASKQQKRITHLHEARRLLRELVDSGMADKMGLGHPKHV